MAGNADPSRADAWGDGQDYESYMGRWSRKLAPEFLAWLELPSNLAWLDVGCGTGALAASILSECQPRSVVGVDRSAPFIDYARTVVTDSRVRFEPGEASALPLADDSVDVVASALAFNFFPDRPAALAEMRRVAKPSAAIAFYVWDYPGGGMGFMDAFWEAAIAVDPAAASAEERSRFPFCTPKRLLEEATMAGLAGLEVRPIEVRAEFAGFEDLWAPFTRGTGPAPAYFQRLNADAQGALRARLKASIPKTSPIWFPARAWALRSRKA